MEGRFKLYQMDILVKEHPFKQQPSQMEIMIGNINPELSYALGDIFSEYMSC